jgi:hypothetical protein
LEDAVGNLDPVCVDFYTLDGLATVLEQTLTNYTGITSNYDTKFDEYVDYIKEIIPDQLNEFMRVEAPYGPGNQFFRCTYNHIGRNSTTGSCPGDIGIISGTYTVYYELVDEEGFYDKLSADYGIDASWVQLGTSTFDETCTPVMDKIGCDPVHSKYIGFPVKAADSVITVTNPKDIMTQALPNLQNLTATISMAKIELALGSWLSGTDDLVQSISMAVFMLSQAVTNMQEVVEVADSYEATKKKELINNILIGVLLVMPFLGEVDLVADAFVGLSRIITLIGDAAVGATTIYAIVEDPKIAPLMILETLLFSGIRNPDKFSAMGIARRGMSKENIKSLGSGIAALDNQFQGIVAKFLAK